MGCLVDLDQYGNRTIETNSNETYGGVNNLGFEVETSTNRLYAPGDLAQENVSLRRMQYDDAGSLKKDTYTGAGDRTYDAENRMTSAVDSTGGTTHYYYDGDGHRVRRVITNQPEVWQVYGIGVCTRYTSSRVRKFNSVAVYKHLTATLVKLLWTASPA
jgi:YD repeat-containing protein